MRRTFFVFCCLCFLSAVHAQQGADDRQQNGRTIALWGHVKDQLTRAGIPETRIILMNEDSTVLDTVIVFNMGQYNATKLDVAYRFNVPAKPARYIIKAEHPDYETTFVNYEIRHVARNTYFDAPWHYMKKRTREMQGAELEEVSVRATRINMIVRGDTLVYNADAFNLPEGSMLDALIRQMDGVELKDNGQILVNGEQIDELTLNGNDFFKGNNKVLLENLPHYTVQNVQVYHKTSDLTIYLGRPIEHKKYVMDVILKREYAEGFIGNAEVARGTSDRYMARLFGMRYTDHSRLTAYGNMNNVNENRHPGSNGEWSPANQPQGQHNLRTVGIDLLIDQADKRWKENLWTQVSWTKTRNETLTSSENFLSNSASTFARSMTENINRRLYLNAMNNFTLYKPFYMEAFAESHYARNKSRNGFISMQTDRLIDEWNGVGDVLDSLFSASLNTDILRSIINRNRTIGRGTGNEFYAGANIRSFYKLAWGDEVGLLINAGYQRNEADDYSFRHLDYVRSGDKPQYINRFGEQPRHFYRFKVSPYYRITWLNGFSLSTEYEYYQRYDRQRNGLWTGDSIAEYENITYPFPDLMNSYERGLMHKANTLRLTPAYHYEKNGKYIHIQLLLRTSNINERLHYMSEQSDTLLRQNKWIFSPELQGRIALDNWMKQINFSYNYDMQVPDLYNKVNVGNTENPLAVRIGNPNLKGTTAHRMQIGFGRRWNEHQQNINFGYGLRLFTNTVSQGYTYNSATGVYTYRPENVKGNWQTYFWNSFGRTLDKNKRLTLNNYTHGDYSRNVDIASTNQFSITESQRLSHVNNWYIENRLTLNYRLNDLSVGLNSYVEYRHANNVEHTISDINALNFSYGATFNYNFKAETLPIIAKGLSVATDIKMYSRRGYGEADLNTNDLVWNASISRTFSLGTKAGSITARLEGFDLLSQLSNTNIVINGQGRTVTVSNSLPRYVMLHLQYNFSKMPKKR